MDEIKYIVAKIDSMDSKLDSVVVIQAVQTSQLEEHMRRTALAEANIELVRAQVRPIAKFVSNLKFLGAVILGLGGVPALVHLIKWLKGNS